MGAAPDIEGQFGQPLAVGAVVAADDEDDVGTLGEDPDRLLAVLRGVADVVLRRTGDRRKALLEAADDPGSVVHGERRLRQVGEPVGSGERQTVDVGLGLDQGDRCQSVTHRADHLVVPLVADEHDVVPGRRITDRLEVDLRHQRAGGVDRGQPPRLRQAPHRGRHAMRREQQHRPLRNLLDRVDEHDALAGEPFHDVLVVDDLVKHVDRLAVAAECGFQGFDRHVDPGAKAAGAGEKDREHAALSRSDRIEKRSGVS